MAGLVCDAMYAVIRQAQNPPVDTNRLYLTGLSYGGGAAFSFPCSFPGRFAAAVPVSSLLGSQSLPQKAPVNFWLLHNESANKSENAQEVLADLAAVVRERGGDFRRSTFPDIGHDAWTKAWQEDVVWDWMFSKTADGKPIRQITTGSPMAVPVNQPRPVAFLQDAKCTASKPGRDEGTGPERVADNLEATAYVSAEPMKRGDWWQIEFATPVSGRIVLKSGFQDGTMRLSPGRVETSNNGRLWTRAGMFAGHTGECRIDARTPVKFLRVLPESATGAVLVLRKIEVER